MAVEFFLYCRDKPGTAAVRAAMTEAHWSFMDGYAGMMIARGPTLNPDRSAATGSMHLVDLPDLDAARVFAFDEPNYRAGVYSDVLIRRWRNTLRCTMWDFTGARPDHLRFLVIGHARPGIGPRDGELDGARERYLAERGYREHLIACGPLLSEDGTGWAGTATLIESPGRSAVEEMIASEPHQRAGWYAGVEIHDCQFGGRR